LSNQATRIWKSLGPKVHELGLLNEVDGPTFGVFCQAYGDWLELTRYLNKLGVLNWYQETESGYRQVIPEIGARNTAYQVMHKIGARFGLDPSSRSGLAHPESAPNAVEEFLFRPQVIA
jgi:P27 family predicted phage terminase small subunit